MAYFADLSPCVYHGGALDAGSWRCQLLAIGWLEYPNEFPKGGQFTDNIRDRLAFLRFAFAQAYPSQSFRGFHDCSWCRGEGILGLGATLRDSHINLLIPDADCVYAAPGRIDHYVERHGYLLPNEFLRALMRCPDPRSDDYEPMLSRANRGVRSPLANEIDGGRFA